MILKKVSAKVGKTTWDLARLDDVAWNTVTQHPLAKPQRGHPVYYRVIQPQESMWQQIWRVLLRRPLPSETFEVWPRPTDNVELVPAWDEQD